MVLWQAVATRLDIVVTAGGEHVHLFLAPDLSACRGP